MSFAWSQPQERGLCLVTTPGWETWNTEWPNSVCYFKCDYYTVVINMVGTLHICIHVALKWHPPNCGIVCIIICVNIIQHQSWFKKLFSGNVTFAWSQPQHRGRCLVTTPGWETRNTEWPNSVGYFKCGHYTGVRNTLGTLLTCVGVTLKWHSPHQFITVAMCFLFAAA